MDKEEELLKILGKLRGGSLEDVADKLLAFFREPEWWEEEFDEQFVQASSPPRLPELHEHKWNTLTQTIQFILMDSFLSR